MNGEGSNKGEAVSSSDFSHTEDDSSSEPALPAYASAERIVLECEVFRPLEQARISSLFGFRQNPVSGKYSFHSGIDLAAPHGSCIRAVLQGTVRTVSYESGYGNYIIIDHEGGISSLYAHCSKIIAERGQAVQAGETIALVGSTGNSTGPHLHIELRKNNKRCDPYELIGGMYA